MKAVIAAMSLAIAMAIPQKVSAWGDEGHEAVALLRDDI
jgi:hypothetical protein